MKDEGKRREGRELALTEEQVRELGSLDRKGTVALAVPYLCEVMILESEAALAGAKPYGDGYAFALAREAGRIAAAQELAARWKDAVERAWEKREKEKLEKF